MSYTLQECIDAMNELISLGLYDESDFYPADEFDTSLGFNKGEPMLKDNDDCIGAYDVLQNYKNKYKSTDIIF